ncbi:hypothetical protein [Ammoniphilus sp. YIM 78166]|uniref:hypothetical protein n=1 Tax=Ammoniphilus sp. YIM 78166 TaxID=1644106 RepID=UPI001430BA4E|nr:hypothetical protein [Ammoniphilus sp. YIM 78166]
MFTLVTTFLIGCSTSTDKRIMVEIEQAMKEKNISYKEIIHTEIIKNGVLVFYIHREMLHTSLFKRQTGEVWTFISSGPSADLNPNKDLSLGVSVKPSIPLSILCGVISNPEIVKVIGVADTWKTEKTAKIVTTESGERIWFAFYEQPIEPIFDVIGLSKDEKVIYKEWNEIGRGQREWLLKHGFTTE